MRKDWTDKTEEMINGIPAIKNKVTKELTLAGKYGEIWYYRPGEYAAIVTSVVVANRLRKALGYSKQKFEVGDEILLHFKAEHFDFIVKKLKIPKKSRLKQVNFANSFGTAQGTQSE